MTPSISLAAWDARPNDEFAAFVASPAFVETASRQRDLVARPVSGESAAIYRFMFGKFAAWMLEHRLRMSTVSAADLRRFITLEHDGKPDLNSKIAYRYLRLLERCFIHLARDPNPARDAILAFDRAHLAQDAPMIALDADALERFLAALPAGRAPGDDSAAGWKRRRDRAMQATMALAGLKVAEAIGLLLEEVGRQADVGGAIELAITPEHKHRTSYEHKVKLPRAGVLELQAWLAERGKLAIPGDLVFPANREGEALHKATVYRQVRASFQRAGLAVPRAGGRTLRNTFASRQLAQGTPADALSTALGLALERSAQAYRYARLAGAEPAPPGDGAAADGSEPSQP